MTYKCKQTFVRVVPSQALSAFSPLLALDHFWHSANAVDIEGVHRHHFLQSLSASLHGER